MTEIRETCASCGEVFYLQAGPWSGIVDADRKPWRCGGCRRRRRVAGIHAPASLGPHSRKAPRDRAYWIRSLEQVAQALTVVGLSWGVGLGPSLPSSEARLFLVLSILSGLVWLGVIFHRR